MCLSFPTLYHRKNHLLLQCKAHYKDRVKIKRTWNVVTEKIKVVKSNPVQISHLLSPQCTVHKFHRYLGIHSSLRIPRLQWNTTLVQFGPFGADMFLVDHWMPHSQNWKYNNRNPLAHLQRKHGSTVPAHQHLCAKLSINRYDWVTEKFKR